MIWPDQATKWMTTLKLSEWSGVHQRSIERWCRELKLAHIRRQTALNSNKIKLVKAVDLVRWLRQRGTHHLGLGHKNRKQKIDQWLDSFKEYM